MKTTNIKTTTIHFGDGKIFFPIGKITTDVVNKTTSGRGTRV